MKNFLGFAKQRKVVFSFAAIILATLLSIIINQLISKPNYVRLNFAHRIVVKRVLEKFNSYLALQKIENGINTEQLVSYDSLLSQLNFIERRIAVDIFETDIAKTNIRGSIMEKSTPYNLVKISSSKFVKDGNIIETGVHFYPRHACKDFNKMLIDMQKATGEVLFVTAGYHSRGYQAYIFIKELVTSDNYSIKSTTETISVPGYSEHEDANYPALDLMSRTGLNGYSKGQAPEDFENLPEVKWLIANAQRYNFYLSYPKNNQLGLKYEPCHWRWVGVNLDTTPEITQGQ